MDSADETATAWPPWHGTTLSLSIEGVPVAKGRPRLGRNGHVYTPAKTQAAERSVRAQIQRQLRDVTGSVFAAVERGPVRVWVDFYLPIPASWSRKRAAEAMRLGSHFGRPDLDNFIKLFLDAANGVLWRDDSQLSQLVARKMYTQDIPRTTIVMEW